MRIFPLLIGCLHGVLLLAQGLPRPGDLAVNPTLVVFQGRTRVQNIHVINTGKEKGVYRLSLQHLQMTEKGELEEVDRFPTSAAMMLRFSPRQIELAPQESQTIRIQVRKPENLLPGEYRIHLLFRAVPAALPVAEPDASEPPVTEGKYQVQLTAIPGVSIPVEIHHGDLKPAFRLENPRRDGGMLHVSSVQAGKMGLRGRLVLLD